MRSGGANLTPQHIEEISLCGLFLMDVVKKIDSQFEAHRTSAHTTPESYKDVSKLSHHLLQQGIVQEMDERQSPSFTDAGLDKICNSSWIWDILDRTEGEDLEREEREPLDLNYELSQVV